MQNIPAKIFNCSNYYQFDKWQAKERDTILSPGEVVFIKINSTYDTLIVIGDGEKPFSELPKYKLQDLPNKPKNLNDYWLQKYIELIPTEIWNKVSKEAEENNCQSFSAMLALAIEELADFYNNYYDVCDETSKSFELQQMDIREADACERFIPKEEQDSKITLLKCPYCKKPMRLIAGNLGFSYWECYNCNKSFEYNIQTETFYDEKDFI